MTYYCVRWYFGVVDITGIIFLPASDVTLLGLIDGDDMRIII